MDNLPYLEPSERDVLLQLFINGPTWAGDISSKTGRGELIRKGLVEYDNGWAYLTTDGVKRALLYRYDREKERQCAEISTALHQYRQGKEH